MPRNASASRKSRKISKSKIRQNSTTSVGQTLATSENNQKSCVQQNKQDSLEHNNLCNSPEPDNLLFVQDYAKLVQQRSLLEVAILCLIFGSDQESGKTLNMSSNWKISDLSKSLVS